MNKIYLSHSGNRRVYVRIGETAYFNNGRTEMIPLNACCQFGSAGVGRYETDDERVQQALESHPSFNRDFILLEGKAAELLKNAKTLIETVPGAKELAEREKLIKEIKVLGLRVDVIKTTTQQLRDEIAKEKIRLSDIKPVELPELSEMAEMPEVKEKVADEPVLVKKRGRRPKNAGEARA